MGAPPAQIDIKLVRDEINLGNKSLCAISILNQSFFMVYIADQWLRSKTDIYLSIGIPRKVGNDEEWDNQEDFQNS